MDINTVRRNLSAVNEGEWVSNIPNFGEGKLKVRGLNSDACRSFQAAREQALTMADRERDGRPSIESRKNILLTSLVEVVLLDWDGLTSGKDENGNAIPLPYSKDTAERYIKDPSFEAFADAIIWSASIVDNGKAVVKETNVKNSK